MGRVTDQQVRKLREEMAKHGVAEVAALRAAMFGRNPGSHPGSSRSIGSLP